MTSTSTCTLEWIDPSIPSCTGIRFFLRLEIHATRTLGMEFFAISISHSFSECHKNAHFQTLFSITCVHLMTFSGLISISATNSHRNFPLSIHSKENPFVSCRNVEYFNIIGWERNVPTNRSSLMCSARLLAAIRLNNKYLQQFYLNWFQYVVDGGTPSKHKKNLMNGEKQSMVMHSMVCPSMSVSECALSWFNPGTDQTHNSAKYARSIVEDGQMRNEN